jgi:hypothetical protein
MERKTIDGLPVYEVVIDDNIETGIDMIAFTVNPAIQFKGLAFSEHKNLWFEDNLKKRITAPAMIPRTIYRNDGGEEYYVEFTKETIEKLHARFMESIAKGTAPVAFNIEHNQNDPVPAYILEAWIVEDSLIDKSYSKFGMSVPVGTLMITAQITDDTYYNNIVKNDQLGFSIEGLFGLYSINKKNNIQMEEMKLPDGEYTVGDKCYVVVDGVVTEIKEYEDEDYSLPGEDEVCCTSKPGLPVKEEEEYTSELPNEQKMQEVLDETAIATICEAIVNEKLTECYDIIAQLKADILAIQGKTEIVTETPVELSAHQRFADVQKNFIKRKYQ